MKIQNTYRKIADARQVLNLPEKASMDEIRKNYRELLKKWHPDTCSQDVNVCIKMTQKINASYEIIMAYCRQYKFSFTREEVQNYISDNEWYRQRFGSDPVWGHVDPKK